MGEKIKVKGFKHLKWKKVEEGDVVFLQGRYLTDEHVSVGCAYGPHKVVNPKGRILMNAQGTKFMHMAEDLMIPKAWK